MKSFSLDLTETDEEVGKAERMGRQKGGVKTICRVGGGEMRNGTDGWRMNLKTDIK